MTASGTEVYPGIYSAVCSAVNADNTINAYVPQVFGNTSIVVNQSTVPGRMPDAKTSGYVIFEGGDPAYPVWVVSPFTGSQGNQGNQGSQGSQGSQGNQGFQGSQGNDGASGSSAGYYGAFHDELTQTAAAINTPYPMYLRKTDGAVGFSIASNSRVTATNAGIYNIQFSAQITKATGSAAYIYIWLRKNGVDITESNSKVAIQGTTAESIPSWNWVISLAANDYVEVMWSVNDTNIQLLAAPASSYAPAIPSVILTVQEIAHTLQGPQGSTGSQGSQGYQGFQGSTGSQGNQGYQGSQGNQGYQGSYGGPQGSQGPQGPQGGVYNIDGGAPDSTYGGILPIDAGGI